MIRKILIAYDGSEPSSRAYNFAIELASKFSAEVVVLSVARPPEPPVDVEMEAV